MQSLSLYNKFAGTLAKIKATTIDGTVLNMEARTLVDSKTETPLDVRVRIMPTY